MKIIGFRNSTTRLRYAVLEINDNGVEFKNANGEHCIKYPKDIEDNPQKLNWLFDEISRILRKHSDAICCAIKTSEYGRAEKKATRFTSQADAVTILASVRDGKEITDFIYSQLPTSSAKVKDYSEGLAGKTDKYWDAQIADAIAVAYAGRAKANG